MSISTDKAKRARVKAKRAARKAAKKQRQAEAKARDARIDAYSIIKDRGELKARLEAFVKGIPAPPRKRPNNVPYPWEYDSRIKPPKVRQ